MPLLTEEEVVITNEDFTDVSSHVSRTEAFLNKLDDQTVNWLWHFLVFEPDACREFGIAWDGPTLQKLQTTNLRKVILNSYIEDLSFKEHVIRAKRSFLPYRR